MIDSVCNTTLIPFSLWTIHGPEVSVLTKAELPYLRSWMAQAQRVDTQVDQVQEPLLAAFSYPHERAWGQMLDWPVIDGSIPWAARAAAEQGLDGGNSQDGWAFITLCNWHVSNGQVTLGDPSYLQIDEATNDKLFKTMLNFFAEDGIVLYPYKLGQWLAHSSLFTNLPTVSLDRVIGRNIDPWLVGNNASSERLNSATKLLRRLQNEVQMLLYTHPVNDKRSLAINSFWIHGTGSLPQHQSTYQDPTVVNVLRESFLQQDLMGWLQAWNQIDVNVIAPMLKHVNQIKKQRLILCGEHEFHVYESTKPSLYKRLRTHFMPTSLSAVLVVDPLKD